MKLYLSLGADLKGIDILVNGDTIKAAETTPILQTKSLYFFVPATSTVLYANCVCEILSKKYVLPFRE